MKSKAISLLSALLLIGVFVSAGQAQNRERFGISAKAGGVNAVSGQVMVKRAGQTAQLLTSQDDLVSGDVVNTGAGSQAEILLNPGTYLRLGENSEFVLADNSLENLLVKLNQGSAIIEATGLDGLELRIPIVTEQQRMTIVRAGIYRINVRPGLTELFVHKGRISLGDDRNNIVKSGKKVTFSRAGQTIAKLEKTDKDVFDEWSKQRGQTLARANQRLSTRTLNGYLSASTFGSSYSRFGRWGLWTWSPFASCYTFLPFYYGWGSPYGRDYGLYAGYRPYYQNRGTVYNSPVITSNPPSSGNGSWGPGTGSSGGPSPGVGSTPGRSTGHIPAGSPGSQAGPRDPDSGNRSINRIRDPN